MEDSEDEFEEMNLSLLSARNFPRKASQTSIFLQEWDIPFKQLEIGELIGKGNRIEYKTVVLVQLLHLFYITPYNAVTVIWKEHMVSHCAESLELGYIFF